MTPDLVTALIEGGLGVVAITSLSYLFWKVVKRLLEDAKEDRDANREQIGKVVSSLDNLASRINNDRV